MDLKSFFWGKRRSNFFRNTMQMLRANIAAQIIVLLSAPVLTRLYAPESFGEFAFFSAATALVVSVASLRFEWLIPNAHNAGVALTLVRLALFFLSISTLIIILVFVVFLVFDHEPVFQGVHGIWALILFPLSIFSFGAMEIFQGWYIRKGNLKPVARVKLTQVTSNTALSLCAGMIGAGTIGMIAALIASSCIGVGTFLMYSARTSRKIIFRNLQPSFLKVLKKFGRQAAFSTAVSFVNTLGANASIFLIGIFYSTQELGWFALMNRLALMPVGLISASVSSSFWSAASDLARRGHFSELRALYLKTLVKLSIAVVPISIFCVAAPFVVGPVFGSADWAPAGFIALAMGPQMLAAIMFSSTTHLIVYERQDYQLACDALSILLIVISVYLSATLGLGIVSCTFFVSLSVSIGYLARFFLHLYANTAMIRRIA